MGKKNSEAPKPEPIDPVAQARANVQAQVEAIPQAAQLQYNVLQNPEYGLLPTTQLSEDVRKQVFPNEQAVREQLVQNVLGQLSSPTGLTSEQEAAVTSRRDQAQKELQDALRTRANLGGGLFGGRSQLTEQRAVQDLQNQFVEEDIARQERNRLNNAQLALAISQILFPNVGLQQPQFINPVVDPSTQFSGAVTQEGQRVAAQTAQDQTNAALQSALYQSLGQAGGSLFGAAGAAQGFGNLF